MSHPSSDLSLTKSQEALLKKAKTALKTKAGSAQHDFLKHLVAEVPDEDMGLFANDVFPEMSRIHWEMAKTHRHQTPKIQIYTPMSKTDSLHKTVIDIVSDDYAFLVDSVVAEINKNNLLIDLVIHPTIYVDYDDKGLFRGVKKRGEKSVQAQSHIHVQIKETLSKEALKKLEDGLYQALEDVYFANRDWKDMLAQLRDARQELARARTKRPMREIERYCAFLDYLYDNNFTLLGFREYEFDDKGNSHVVKKSSLGLLADDVKPAYINDSKERLPRNLQELRRNLDPVSISKTNRLSTVHRRVPMDAIAVKRYDADGNVIGEKLFLGLFTSVTYSRSVSSVPLLRDKVDDVVEMTGFVQGSHDRKALRHILEKYPRDELFQIPVKELHRTALSILRLQERQRIALYTRRDPFGRYISALIYIPRDRFGTDLRQKMIEILEEELGGKCTSFNTSMDDSMFARIMAVIKVDMSSPPAVDNCGIEVKLQEVGQTWPELLAQAYLDDGVLEDAQITALTIKYGHAFPTAYTERYRAKQALFDIDKLETVLQTGKMQIDLYRPDDMDGGQLRLKLYSPGEPVTLSDVMPILDNMGLKSIAELPFEITPEGQENSVWIHDFFLETPSFKEPIVVEDVKQNFERAFIKTWYGDVESDGLNRLILSANTNWHEISIIRAYTRYLTQIRYPFSRPYIIKALSKHPKIIRLLVDLFKAQFNPENGAKGEAKAEACMANIHAKLKQVESLDEDRILRIIAKLMQATMRTNYYVREDDGTGKPYLALKISSRDVAEIPDPKPFMEIFVYSPRVEAVHLRGDKIARGGLRWSDRHEDFRTEILGLMKAQMVKNAVIVPMGSKGGFVIKRPTASRDEFIAEGIDCYKIFIRGLLDITDNRKGNKVIPPKSVVRRDEDDPYLVVAADKGTATFSDIANGLSEEYGFWLGDAFASGGSAGYDHKKMGITARGAWESVKLHFRQLNHNTQEQPFDVVGVGDMGGDVFGNGMLLSKHIRLIGAFNHLHIFCDPDPDPAKSFKERQRLFKGVKGWGDYKTDLLSKGGQIYERSEKSLKLTPEIKQRFDIDQNEVSPNELIRAMLKSRTDLLWFGGIGTYIKGTTETHEQAGDKANDALRIDAPDVRAKVLGEGANLGTTQLARIEMAERGVRLNTDFIDNSAGVDSSDHEVNIKILLSDVMSQKGSKMDTKARNKLLEDMTDEVADLCLRNNYQQGQALSLSEMEARENLQTHEAFIQDLERNHGLNRKLEALPDPEEVQNRLRLGKGLTRPEMSILLSYSKIRLAQDLLASDIPDNKDMEEWFVEYFPKVLQKRYIKEIFRHRLRREIVATTMSNSLVNRMGPIFVTSQVQKTGARIEDIVKAYIIVRDAFGLRALWDQIEALDNKVPAEVQMRAMLDIARLSEHAIGWFLKRNLDTLDIAPNIKEYKGCIETLRAKLEGLLTDELKTSVRQRTESGKENGLPPKLAKAIALLPVLSSACDIIRISLEEKTDLLVTARTYFALGERFCMDWLRNQARFMQSDDRWQGEAIEGLVDQLYTTQANLSVRILDSYGRKPKDADVPLEKWLDSHDHLIKQIDPFLSDLRRHGGVDLAKLVIAGQRLSSFYGG